MIPPENQIVHLNHFVARCMDHLPDSLSARKEDLVTLLSLLPKWYPRRQEIVIVLRGIQQHEAAQATFRELLNNGGDQQ